MISETWPAGWYQDPWFPDQSRYWNGAEWTPDVRPGIPPAPAGPRRRSRAQWVIGGALLIAVAVIAGVIAALRPSGTHSAAVSPTTVPSGPLSSDPDASRLVGLGLRPSDAPRGDVVALLPAGNRVGSGDAATLNLCNLAFASESQRTARYQVELDDAGGDPLFSTESVLYGTAGGTAQAFTELRQAASRCPASSGSISTADDHTWPSTASVERLAFNVTSVDSQGNELRSVVVYLRRGRALMGLYFYATAARQPAVAGRTTVPSIVQLFSGRLRALPGSAVAAPGAVDFPYPGSGNG